MTDRTPSSGTRSYLRLGDRRDQRYPADPSRAARRASWWLAFVICVPDRDALSATPSPGLFIRGVGIWGINIPVGWGFDIINFVWWIGIGHAGTLISAILLLLRQDWRTSINRFAEAMTLFAVANAALFPILHLGRPWLFFYLMPYPNTHAPVAAVPQPAGLGRVCHHSPT